MDKKVACKLHTKVDMLIDRYDELEKVQLKLEEIKKLPDCGMNVELCFEGNHAMDLRMNYLKAGDMMVAMCGFIDDVIDSYNNQIEQLGKEIAELVITGEDKDDDEEEEASQ